MRFSASRLAMWMNCPLQAHFRYDKLLPTSQNAKASFGTIIHHVLDRYHNGLNVEECVEEFKNLWEHPDILNVAPDYWPKYTTYSSLKQKGVEIIREYHDKNRWDTKKVIASEHRFLVPFGDHELYGVVDFIDMKKGRGSQVLRIVDLKTAGKTPSKAELRLNIQFTTYMYASMQPEFYLGNGPDFPPMEDGQKLWHDVQRMDRRAVWYHLMTNKEIDAGERDDGDYMRLYRVCDEIQRAVTLGVHVPKIGESCILCDYSDPCGVPIPTQQELEEEEFF